MGLLDSLLGGMSMKDPVEGTAQVVSCSGYNGRGVMQNCRMQLVVEAEGIEPTAVEHNELVHNRKWPMPGIVLPAVIDRGNPEKLKLDWDQVADSRERAQDSAEAIAAARRGEGGAGGGLGGAQVINLGGGDLSQLSDEQRQKLAALGIDPAALGAAGAAAGGGTSDASDEGDDRLDQLQKLADLKERGALTEKEFEAEKRRLLGG